MKFKFDKEVFQVIQAICALPETATSKEDYLRPKLLINRLEDKIKQQLDSKQIGLKHFSMVKWQISFLWAIVFVCQKAAMKKEGLNPDLKEDQSKPIDEFYAYALFVDIVKKIKSNEELKNPSIVRLGLKYGIIFLSDFEIQALIDGNRIQTTQSDSSISFRKVH
jgi:hypothetical protein